MRRFLPLTVILALYYRACQCQALYMDSGGGTHGDTAMPGFGTVNGLGALFFGFCAPDGLVIPWAANIFLALASLFLVWKRNREMLACALAGLGLSLTTPLLLWFSSHHPLAHPLEGYYWWQASFTAMLLAAPGARRLRVILAIAAIGALIYVPIQFRQRQRGIVLEITAQVPAPEGTWITFALPGVTWDHQPKRTVQLGAALDRQGKVSLVQRLNVLGPPQTVQVSGPDLPVREFPMQVQDNVYSANIQYTR